MVQGVLALLVERITLKFGRKLILKERKFVIRGNSETFNPTFMLFPVEGILKRQSGCVK